MKKSWLWLIIIAIMLYSSFAYTDGLPATLNREWFLGQNDLVDALYYVYLTAFVGVICFYLYLLRERKSS